MFFLSYESNLMLPLHPALFRNVFSNSNSFTSEMNSKNEFLFLLHLFSHLSLYFNPLLPHRKLGTLLYKGPNECNQSWEIVICDEGLFFIYSPFKYNSVLSWRDLLVAVLRNHREQTSLSNEDDAVTGCTGWFPGGRCLGAESPKACYPTSSLQMKM